MTKQIAIYSSALIVGCIFYIKSQTLQLSENIQYDEIKIEIENQELFIKGIVAAEDYSIKNIEAAIIPHDIISAPLIASLFKTLQSTAPKQIVLIGPNHDNVGKEVAYTAGSSWRVGTDIIFPNINLINKLQIPIQNNIIEKEHSITAVIPFIFHYLPEAEIIPIIIRTDASLENVEKIFQKIQKQIPNAIIVGSIDFSHYLNTPEALARDEETIRAIEDRNYQWLLDRGSDHLDSPETLAVLMKTADRRDLNMNIVKHTNSGELQNNPDIETTSHFLITFEKEDE